MGRKRLLYYLLGLCLGFLILLVMQLPSGEAKMIVCDVGQGDAILITKGSIQVLIDGGPSSEKVLSCLGAHMPFWDRTIELIVLTNTDSDHMSGLSNVVERYHVIQFVTSDGVHDSSTFSHFVQVLATAKVVPRGVERGDTIYVGKQGKLRFQVLWPPDTRADYVAVFSNQIRDSERKQILIESAKRSDLNDRSVVLLLLEAHTSVLLTGDAGFQTETALLKTGGLPQIDVLKVGHHGSKYATSQVFLAAIRPKLAVISVGAKNTYGHPAPETLERLSKIGSKVERTDQQGEIVLDLH